MGIRDKLAAKADQARDAAVSRAREAADSAKDVAGSARDAATARARDVVSARVEGSALVGFLRMDDERRITIEAVTVLLVAAVRKDEERELSDRDVLKAARRRYRRLGTLSLPSGPLGGVVVNLYCEAATLCDVVELRGTPLSDQAVAAHLLVLWGVTPDVQAAANAISGLGPNAAAILAVRARERAAEIELPDPMTKRGALLALRRLRGVAEEAGEVEGTGIRERLFPGRRVAAFVEEAGAQLQHPVVLPSGTPAEEPPTAE